MISSSRLWIPVLVATTACALPAVGQEVTLPLERYEELRHQAHPAPEPTPPAAVPVAVERAWLEITPTADSARVRCELTLTVIGDGWQEVALPAGESYLAAELGGLEGRLADGRLVVRGRGRHRVVLESVSRLVVDDSSARPLWSLAVTAPTAAVVAGVVRTPPAMNEVVVVAGGVARGHDADGGVLLAGVPGQILRLNLLGPRRGPAPGDLPLRFSASSAALLELARNRHRLLATLTARVAQGELGELRASLPAGWEVVDASGDGVAGWDVVDGAVVMSLASPVTTAVTAQVELSAAPATTFASPFLVPVGATATTFATALTVQGDGLLELVDQASGRFPEPPELAALPSSWQGRNLAPLVVVDPARAPAWSVDWANRAEVLAAQVDRLLVDVLAGSSGHAAYQLWLELRSSGAATVAVTLPPGFTLTAAGRDGRALIPGRAGERLILPLAAGSARQVVHLAGLVPLAVPVEGRLSVPLPALSAPASVVEARLVLPPGASYVLEPVQRAGLVSPPPSPAREATGGGPLAELLAAGPGRPAGDAWPGFFAAPGGSLVSEAAWSAMTSDPAPLTLAVTPERTRREWF